MTAIVVALPPRSIAKTTDTIVDETPLSREQTTAILDGVVQDGLRAAHESGGPLSIWIDESTRTVSEWNDPRGHARNLIEGALPSDAPMPEIDTESPTEYAAIAAAIERTNEASGAVLIPGTPFVQRRHIDEAAMRLRQTDVVLGPATAGTWYLFGHREEVEFSYPEDSYLSSTIARQATASDYSMNLLRTLPGIWDGNSLADAVTTLTIADYADLSVGPFTRAWLEQHSIQTVNTAEGPRIRET